MAETKRPTSPAAEEILGLYFPVLDHGFVSLVDYMGTDECIERAARVSYGYGTRKQSMTRGLLRYLRRHKHTTPSEMVELKFHCCMPIFIARQWIRHRTACLAGDARLSFDLPGAANRRGDGRQHHAVSIGELHRLWHHGTQRPIGKKKPSHLERIELDREYTIPELARVVQRREGTLRNYVRDGALSARRRAAVDPRKPTIFVTGAAWREFATRKHFTTVDMKPRLRRMKLRSCDEDTGEIIHTGVVDVWESGIKPVFRVTLENGKSLKMSKDHRCLTERGWMTLEKAASLRVGPGGSVSWASDAPRFSVNGVPAYQDESWLRARRAEGLGVQNIAERAGTSCHTVRAYLRKFQIQFTAAERGKLSGLAQRGGRRSFSTPQEWHAPARVRDLSNLMTLGAPCHDRARADDLELQSLDAGEHGRDLEAFWIGSRRHPRPAGKKASKPQKLVRTFSRIAKIELEGEEMTYDLEVAGPYHNFVADGFIVHNSVNEYSGRYSLIPMLFYTPGPEQLQTQSKRNNQGRSGQQVADDVHAEAIRRWTEIRRASTGTYEWMTSGEIARELARIDLPLSTYTQWYWKIDLHNLLHFLTLRVDTHAQWEIQEFGRVMAGMLKRVAPMSYEAWIDYDVCGGHLSRMELDALRGLVSVEGEGLKANGGALTKEALVDRGLSKREVDELLIKLAPARPTPDFELDMSTAKPADHFAARFADAVPKADRPPAEG